MKRMSTLIRFEDAYGIYSMYKQVPGDISEYICEHGLSNSSVLKVNNNKARRYRYQGIDNILFVFDVDNQTGNNSDIINLDKFKQDINILLDNLETNSISYGFIPVVYCAETINLYEYYGGNLDIEGLVSKVNTKELHLSLLRLMTGLNSGIVKNMSHVDYEKLKRKLTEYRNKSKFNKRVIDLILDKNVIGYTYDEMVIFIENLQDYFNECKQCEDIMINYDNRGISVLKSNEDIKQLIYTNAKLDNSFDYYANL
jgi:hypothetical protein